MAMRNLWPWTSTDAQEQCVLRRRGITPGTSGVFNQAGFRMAPYFHLRRYVHTASYAATVHHVRLCLRISSHVRCSQMPQAVLSSAMA